MEEKLIMNRFAVAHDYNVYGEINMKRFLQILLQNTAVQPIGDLVVFIRNFIRQIRVYAFYRTVSHIKGILPGGKDSVPADYYDFMKTPEGQEMKKGLFQMLGMDLDVYRDQDNYALFLSMAERLKERGVKAEDAFCMTFDASEMSFTLPDGATYLLFPEGVQERYLSYLEENGIAGEEAIFSLKGFQVFEMKEHTKEFLTKLALHETEVPHDLKTEEGKKNKTKEQEKNPRVKKTFTPIDVKEALAKPDGRWVSIPPNNYYDKQKAVKEQILSLTEEEKKRTTVRLSFKPEHLRPDLMKEEPDKAIIQVPNGKYGGESYLLVVPRKWMTEVKASEIQKRWQGMSERIEAPLSEKAEIRSLENKCIGKVKIPVLSQVLLIHGIKMERDPERFTKNFSSTAYLDRMLSVEGDMDLRGFHETAEAIRSYLSDQGLNRDSDGKWMKGESGVPEDYFSRDEIRMLSNRFNHVFVTEKEKKLGCMEQTAPAPGTGEELCMVKEKIHRALIERSALADTFISPSLDNLTRQRTAELLTLKQQELQRLQERRFQLEH